MAKKTLDVTVTAKSMEGDYRRYQAGYDVALSDIGRGKVFAPRATDDAWWAAGYRAACAANGKTLVN